MKRRMTSLLACLLALLMPLLAGAEQTTLTYSYGSEAQNKHMLDVANTVEYGGKTYTFDRGGFEFKGAFNMYGGNVRTVFECEVPRAQMAIHGVGEELFLGQVIIDPPGPMTLHVFSGDRVSGQYTLIDSQTVGRYILNISATRDEAGNLRLVDQVFLYSCVQDGKEVNYAASLYITYEGVVASPAEGAPASAAANTAAVTPVPANPEAELATYISMVRILEDERANLCAQLAEKDTEIARLTQQNAALADEKTKLTEQAAGKDAEITRLTGEVTGLTQQNAALADEKTKLTEQAAEKDTEIARLTGEVTGLTQQNAALAEEKTKLTEQAAGKDAEITRLTGEVDRLTQQIAELSAANDSLRSQVSNAVSADEVDALQARIVELEAANAALQMQVERAADLNDLVAQLEKEVIALRAGDASLSAGTTAPTPMAVPTATLAPTTPPTPEPTAVPTATPTLAPTTPPTPEPTEVPTATPTAETTPAPTAPPTPEPTAVPAPVETAETVITFRERPWGTGADDIAQWLLDAGIVTNQYSLFSGGHAWLQPCYYPYVYLAADGSIPAQNSYMAATKILWANQFLSADFRVAGYEVENLYFAFAAQGDETKLIGVSVDFRCPEGEEAAFAEVQQKLRDTYGAGNEDDDTHYLRFGQNNTALHLFRRPYDGLILTYGDTTAVATLESMTK